MQRLLSQIGRTQRLNVINLLKRSGKGMTVKELCAPLEMSYMGVKQICLDLEKDGYLTTFRRHRGVGRPEILYRLSEKAQDLFPKADNALGVSLLEQARKLYGAAAPGKILFLHFQQRTADYAAKLKDGSIEDKVQAFVKIRDQEGYMADVVTEPSLQVVERHHPMQELAQKFPEVDTLERDMIQKILGAPVRVEVIDYGANFERIFFVG